MEQSLAGSMEDAVPDVVELVVASILVQIWVEHAYTDSLIPLLSSPGFMLQYPSTA